MSDHNRILNKLPNYVNDGLVDTKLQARHCWGRLGGQQQSDHRYPEEIQSASSDSMPKIAMTYQPNQPPKTFHFPENDYGKQKRFRHWEFFCEESEKRRLIFGRF